MNFIRRIFRKKEKPVFRISCKTPTLKSLMLILVLKNISNNTNEGKLFKNHLDFILKLLGVTEEGLQFAKRNLAPCFSSGDRISNKYWNFFKEHVGEDPDLDFKKFFLAGFDDVISRMEDSVSSTFYPIFRVNPPLDKRLEFLFKEISRLYFTFNANKVRMALDSFLRALFLTIEQKVRQDADDARMDNQLESLNEFFRLFEDKVTVEVPPASFKDFLIEAVAQEINRSTKSLQGAAFSNNLDIISYITKERKGVLMSSIKGAIKHPAPWFKGPRFSAQNFSFYVFRNHIMEEWINKYADKFLLQASDFLRLAKESTFKLNLAERERQQLIELFKEMKVQINIAKDAIQKPKTFLKYIAMLVRTAWNILYYAVKGFVLYRKHNN